ITSFSVTNNGTEDVLRITEAGSDFDVPLSNIGTDDQNAGEVAVADAGDNFTTDTVEAALAELAGRTDNDTQYTAGNGLNLDGSNEFTAVASPDANNALDVRANGIYATDTDDQTAGEVAVADAGDNFTTDTVEAALAELAGRTDNDTQYTAGNGLNLDGSNEFTAVASPDANNALDVRANGIYATDTDDQTAGEVAVADAGDNFTTDTVEAALAELAGRTDNDTQYTAGNGLNLDGSNEFTAVASPDANNALDVRANGIYATDDQTATEVAVTDAGDNFTVDTVEAALAELAGRTDNDTQYTAGNGLNLDGSNEFTAVASPDANNALDVRANGIYATDDQNAGEVTVADAGDNFTVDTVEAALAELAGRTDNDTQYTAGNGLNLDGSNEFTAVASPDANNALDVRANGIYATDTDDQTATEVAVADAGDNFTVDTVEAALAELAGRTDNDTQYTAGNG
ncbi:hypothetical protein, partial [Croceitalea sp. MTPC5]|uniref:hypothetical protein n=1 Tax=Croceitalea sp. MTPC5 TaxID=3056565 RepID=UPI0030D46D13